MAVVGSLVAPFDAFGRADVSIAGGKGANLGELTRAGFPVPPGFVVTTYAYDLVVEQAGLRHRIAAALPGVDPSSPPTAASASRAIQEAFDAAPIPAEVAEAVLAASRRLGAGPVAVSSSATAEDLPGATFAGQQDTYLNAIGEDAVLAAVRRCWASLWSDRAIVYRARRQVDQGAVKLAVVVQQMVMADVAGVLFTANPVTGSRDEIVLDASPGLGEAVVGGLVTPDHFVVDKRTRAIRERQVGRREVVVRPLPGGGTAQARPDGPPGVSHEACLPDAAVAELAGLAVAVERHYGAAQDLEWALADGKLSLLQARPMTALPAAAAAPPVPAATAGEAPAQERRAMNLPARLSGLRGRGARPRFVAGLLGELFPMRPFPLDISSYTRVLMVAIFENMFAPLGMSYPPPEQEFLEEDGVVVGIRGFGPRPTLRMLYQPWLSLWRNRRYDVAHWQDDPIITAARQRARALQSRDLTALSWDDLLRTMQEALDLLPFVATLRRRYLPQVLRDALLLGLLLAVTGQRRHFSALLSGVETKTLEMNRALEALAARVRANQELREVFATTAAGDLPPALEACPPAQEFVTTFWAFLDEYGHRETLLLLASQPAWRNAPEVPLGVLKGLAAAEPPTVAGLDGHDGGDGPERQLPWQRERDDLLARSILGKGRLRRLFTQVLEGARRFPQVREDTHFYLTLGLPVTHAAFTEFGRRLAQAGAIGVPEDVFHLKLGEVAAAGRPWPPSAATVGRVQELVARRRAKRDSLAGRPWPDAAMPAPLDATGGAVLA
ncbi:MAG: PEP/pyruvate-binding domain-containing protein, partial [Chloroflexota bacterium]